MYCTQQDLIDRFGEQEIIQLSDRANPPSGAIDAAVVGQAISDASDEIDGYVGARYALPLPVQPSVLGRVACDIARYRLADALPTAEMRKRYEDAVQLLRQIAKGLVSLGLPAQDTPAPAVGKVLVESSPRRFSRGRLENF